MTWMWRGEKKLPPQDHYIRKALFVGAPNETTLLVNVDLGMYVWINAITLSVKWTDIVNTFKPLETQLLVQILEVPDRRDRHKALTSKIWYQDSDSTWIEV
jgi:hypothetical protein